MVLVPLRLCPRERVECLRSQMASYSKCKDWAALGINSKEIDDVDVSWSWVRGYAFPLVQSLRSGSEPETPEAKRVSEPIEKPSLPPATQRRWRSCPPESVESRLIPIPLAGRLSYKVVSQLMLTSST
ncbi:hypothetical protein EVAR_23762_1 [Eumeta japonica]|uniref:Uncharacterized protein n=1 Tax=Eumeta variegata TaxID=151549 RepID=A0A4C1VGG1_EUMVA|nr:hypothetical protein EVAR_23762_1 [Eumeta japonica]